jgi:hypothetical protein
MLELYNGLHNKVNMLNDVIIVLIILMCLVEHQIQSYPLRCFNRAMCF